MAVVLASEDGGVQRYTKQDLDDLVTNKYKTFTKLKCAECNADACKRFNGMMSFVAKQMLDTCWCNECGRVLCDKHRYSHTCERLDQQKERNKNITKEELARQLAEAEALKQAAEDAKKDEARAAAEIVERQRLERKGKRELLAKKAKIVENFLQGISRNPALMEARGTRARDELLDLYTKARRISLTLYNEYEHPTLPDLAVDDWEEVKEIYSRAVELSGMRAATEDGPLDMRNPWDPPPDEATDTGAQDIGLGRGIL